MRVAGEATSRSQPYRANSHAIDKNQNKKKPGISLYLIKGNPLATAMDRTAMA
jgi:hypothetical protein